MLLREIISVLEKVAPTNRAESWDNVGLIAGDPLQPVVNAMLTIDYTEPVAQEAKRKNCSLVIAYHPPLFEGVKKLTAGHLIFDAIQRGVAVYSPHTALDIADGGTNDMLADAVGIGPRQPLRLVRSKSNFLKFVVFVPEAAIEEVSAAIFAAGAGSIGQYSCCSFRGKGIGTFFGDSTTHPAVGERGRLERVDEWRLESIVPHANADAVVRAMRNAHPYESPAYDLMQLTTTGSGGMGRVGILAEPANIESVIDRIKHALGLKQLLVAGPRERIVRKAAVCAGACGEYLGDAIAQQVDLYLTGEMRHHDALKAASAGLTVICTLHSNSERAILVRLRDRLNHEIRGVSFQVSEADRDPFEIL